MHSRVRDDLIVIEPDRKLFDLKLVELWSYRDLIALLVRRDFVAHYKQTILGPTWHVLQALLMSVVFTIVFAGIARIPTDGAPPFLFYMLGISCWSYFSNVATSTGQTFVSNAHLYGKVYFPRLVLPLATMCSRAVPLAIQFVIFLCALGYVKVAGGQVDLNLGVLLTPLYVLMLAAFGLGLGLLICASTVRYRDAIVAVGFFVQVLLYLTPVVYPLSAVPQQWRVFALANPICPILEALRYAYLGIGGASGVHLAYSCVAILLTLFTGMVLFHRVERTFVDTI